MIELDSGSASGYSRIDQTDTPSQYIARLDAMRSDPFWQMVKNRTFASLAIQNGENVLDVGCGTGGDVRTAAALVGPTGLAVGIDLSRTMLAEACARNACHQLPIAFAMSDARRLCFADASFDACRVERVLQHIESPALVLHGLARVLRPRGRLVVVEPDYRTLLIDGADPAFTKRILAHRRAHFASPQVGSQVPSLLKVCGFTDIQLTLFRSHITTLDEVQFASLRTKYSLPAAQAGIISEKEESTWLREIDRAGREGRFQHSVTIFLVRAQKYATKFPS